MALPTFEILVVDDNPDDVALTCAAFKNSKLKVNLHVAEDGEQALDFLYQRGAFTAAPLPDLIFLDLNMPRKDGYEVLTEVKQSEKLKFIPIVVMTTSDAQADVIKSYNLGCNCFATKPVGFKAFCNVIKQIEEFWLTVVKLPKQ